MQAKQPDKLQVKPLTRDSYCVVNWTKSTVYLVAFKVAGQALVCDCPARKRCKHIAAVEQYQRQNAAS